MKIEQKRGFERVYKKLHANQRRDVDNAIRTIMSDTTIGQVKTGDLAGIRIYKFKMVGQLMLMAYIYENEILTLTLLGLGSHENFYQDLKKSLS